MLKGFLSQGLPVAHGQMSVFTLYGEVWGSQTHKEGFLKAVASLGLPPAAEHCEQLPDLMSIQPQGLL